MKLVTAETLAYDDDDHRLCDECGAAVMSLRHFQGCSHIPPDPCLAALLAAARDGLTLAKQEHGHGPEHHADWPSCLPAHVAMNRLRDALAAFDHE